MTRWDDHVKRWFGVGDKWPLDPGESMEGSLPLHLSCDVARCKCRSDSSRKESSVVGRQFQVG